MKRPTLAAAAALAPATQVWLALCVLGVQALHAIHLPATLALAGPATVALAWLLWRKGWRAPTLLLLALAVLLALLVRRELAYLVGRDPGVAFLAVAVGIKLLEVRNHRDVSATLCLVAFLLPTVFFYSHSIPTTLAVLGSSLLLLGAFVATRQSDRPMSWRPALRLAGTLMLQGLPVALALFVLFPRLSGPLWALSSERVARSGLSERMDPGTVTQLSLSDDIAFRVDFSGPPPPSRELYWRGPVLTRFDGRSWYASFSPTDGNLQPNEGRSVTYTVSLEPHDRFWLFALDVASSIPPQARLTHEQQLLSLQPVVQLLQYRQSSVLTDRYPATFVEEVNNARVLPRTGNPRSREWAERLKNQSADAKTLIETVLRNFREEAFYYTLEPPAYGRDGIDAFLFDQKRGFCEHYAGAFAFVMRAAGIPARVVTGYQGGEVSPVGGYLIVRQADAHAWAEVWIDQRWQRIDPTAAVAPQRIEFGLGAALPASDRVPMMAKLQDSWIKTLRLRWDAASYRWQRWVVEFNRERQELLWENLGMPRPEPWQVVAVILGIGGIWLTLLALWLLRQRQSDPVQQLWNNFCHRLARAGLPRALHEPPLAYGQRAARAWPDAKEAILGFARAYCAARYGPTASSATVAALRRQLARMPQRSR